MKRTITFATGLFAGLVLILALFASVVGSRPAETVGQAGSAAPAAPIRVPHAPGELLIKLRPGVTLRSGPAGKRPTSNAGELDALLAEQGVQAAQQVFAPVARRTTAQAACACRLTPTCRPSSLPCVPAWEMSTPRHRPSPMSIPFAPPWAAT